MVIPASTDETLAELCDWLWREFCSLVSSDRQFHAIDHHCHNNSTFCIASSICGDQGNPQLNRTADNFDNYPQVIFSHLARSEL